MLPLLNANYYRKIGILVRIIVLPFYCAPSIRHACVCSGTHSLSLTLLAVRMILNAKWKYRHDFLKFKDNDLTI